MHGNNRVGPLAGLVSPAAEALFLRLHADGVARIGDGIDEADLAGGAAGELLDLGLVVRSGPDGELIRPVGQPTGLRLLLDRRQRELAQAQRRVLDGWARLVTLLPDSDVPAGSIGSVGSVGSVGNVGNVGNVEGILPLTEQDQVLARAAKLCSSVKHRLRGTDTGALLTHQPAPAVRTQLICRAATARPSGHVRLRHHLPMTMLHVDDVVALVSLDRAAQAGVLVWAPGLLAALAEWFDLLWDDPATLAPPATPDRSLTATQRQVLELMAADADEVIARRLKISITTVRRHVKHIYATLGVDNRFAAGVAAVKRGWL